MNDSLGRVGTSHTISLSEMRDAGDNSLFLFTPSMIVVDRLEKDASRSNKH
jgi:hypothetical protein